MEDFTPHLLYAAHTLIVRNETANSTSPIHNPNRPPVYKAIGLSLAIASGLFIGVSFVLKKVGLLNANEKYHEEAGEGYGYLKNAYWWGGMTLMILGEICNFVAYAFTDAILVTPLGALSVVVTTILSAIFLKERLSFVGKIGCFNCIIGSVVIVMNAPEQSAVADIQEMKHFVIAPGFLTYTGLVVIGAIFIALWAGPRYGKKSMFVYLSVCSFVGGLSVVATQGLGAAVVAQASVGHQFNQWFLYVLLVFVVCTLLVEIVYLNKALNIFNAALVTPTYYVFFTSTTIITSAILFRGFHGSGAQIATVVMGFLQICAGVVLLQLSKSAKDVPDAAIFKGDLDQVREVAEQEAAESEPKADAIRGTASIIRRLSTARQRMEQSEARRLREEKLADLEPVAENEVVEWDGLRRRKTILGPGPVSSPSLRRKTIHPPLGMSHFPDPNSEEEDRDSSGFFSGMRERTNTLLSRPKQHAESDPTGGQTVPHPVPLTDIQVYGAKADTPITPYGPGSLEDAQERIFGHPVSSKVSVMPSPRSKPLPTRPASSPKVESKSGAKRQFSFSNILHRSRQNTGTGDDLAPPPSIALSPRSHSPRGSIASDKKRARKHATEEEKLGLVTGDSRRALLDTSPDRARGEPFPAFVVDSPDQEVSSSKQPFSLPVSRTHPGAESPGVLSDSDGDGSWQMMPSPLRSHQPSFHPSPKTSISNVNDPSRPSSRRRPEPPTAYVSPYQAQTTRDTDRPSTGQRQPQQTLRAVAVSNPISQQVYPPDPSRSEPTLLPSLQVQASTPQDSERDLPSVLAPGPQTLATPRPQPTRQSHSQEEVPSSRMYGPPSLTFTPEAEELDGETRDRFAQQSAREREQRRQRQRQSVGGGNSAESGSQPPPTSS